MREPLIFQIYYDEVTRRMLDPGFVPLDNTANARPDWFEFWVIRNWLHANALEEGRWYGFLSPKFLRKTGVGSGPLRETLARVDAVADVALFSPGWDQIAYYLNPFEQGEVFHPGLMAAAQRFVDECGLGLALGSLVSHSASAAFSNFVIAKPPYWRRWLPLADALFQRCEGESSDPALTSPTRYGSGRLEPMKVFVQERFPSLLLADGALRVVAADLSRNTGLHPGLFVDEARTRRLLLGCDLLKQEYCRSGDPSYLDVYRRLRASIPCLVRSPAGNDRAAG